MTHPWRDIPCEEPVDESFLAFIEIPKGSKVKYELDKQTGLLRGWLYFTANQLHRQPQYHDGNDERVKPYTLFRVKTDSTPVRLLC